MGTSKISRKILVLFIISNLVCVGCKVKKEHVVSRAETISKEKSLIDFFLPMEPRTELVSEDIWGGPNVLPRDINNGLEDSTLEKWCYWDGAIVKGDDGMYHMYASRWTQKVPHSIGWKKESKAIHATSKHVSGPYIDQGLLWPDWKDGIGHNVVALRTHEGKYAVITSESTKGELFIADKPEGPFQFLGEIETEANGFDPGLAKYDVHNEGAVKGNKVGYMSNVQILPYKDGTYLLIPRSTAPMVSETGILGPYKIMADRVYEGLSDIPQAKMEDPSIWFSGGMYHMVVNYHPDNTSYHFTSKDGIKNWKYRGIAHKRASNIFKYADGTMNKWQVVQRMTVYVENGHPTHFLFSVIDSGKGDDKPNDNHGSKIVVVPFDGEAFDKYMQRIEYD